MRLTPTVPAHAADSLLPAPHQMRERRPGEWGSIRCSPVAAAERAVLVALGDALTLDRAEEGREVLSRDVGAARIV